MSNPDFRHVLLTQQYYSQGLLFFYLNPGPGMLKRLKATTLSNLPHVAKQNCEIRSKATFLYFKPLYYMTEINRSFLTSNKMSCFQRVVTAST